VKREHPGIFTIAYSRNQVDYLDCVQSGRADLFISKQQIESSDHDNFLLEMFQKHLQINASAYVPTDFLQQDVGTFFTRHLLDLNRAVRKLTFTRTTGVRNEDVGEVRLKRLPSGFSGALVFQMTAYTNTQFPCVQAILKIALNKNRIAVDALERELTNYRAYVRWYLPYHFGDPNF
jgi:hypothetical protein